MCHLGNHALPKLPHPLIVCITPNGICEDASRAVDLAVEALAGGATLVQLRDRDASPARLRRTSQRIAEVLPSPSSLVINGPHSIQIAAQLGQDVGVHLRECDIDSMIAGALIPGELSPGAFVGCSVHSVAAAQKALTPIAGRVPSYLQIGTMFPTGSHPGKTPEGPGLVREIRKAVGRDITLVAVGGLVESNIGSVVQHDAANGAAIISGIASADSPRLASRRLLEAATSAWS